MERDALLLALDAGSPVVSVAVGRRGEVLAGGSVEIGRSSERLLGLVDEALREAGATAAELGGVVALRGPGSFTGLRVGLATALGLHQALGIPATALDTLEVLAAAAPEASRAVGAVDALRGEWFVQAFAGGPTPTPEGKARLLPASELGSLAPCTLVGFGVAAAVAAAGGACTGIACRDPGPLAPVTLRLLARRAADRGGGEWDGSLLTRPLYLRPPAATAPAVPRRRTATGGGRR